MSSFLASYDACAHLQETIIVSNNDYARDIFLAAVARKIISVIVIAMCV
jgi:hypothetical protein